MRTKRRPNELHMTPVSTKHFTRSGWNLVSEESDLRANCGPGWMGQVWNDSCDVGILLKSHRTGKEVKFFLVREERRDGELLAWEFEPEDRVESGGIEKVIVFND